MELMLEIISRHKFLADIKPSYIFGKVGGYIGRSDESDWILPDKSKKISRKHLLINNDGQNFYLEDVSSNGVLSNITQELIGKDGRYKISHGDSFQVGDYILQARLLKNPEIYNTPELDESTKSSVIPDNAFLDLDPLVAMEQQDMHQARGRLGLYNDLLHDQATEVSGGSMPDHNAAGLNAMLSVKAVAEDRQLKQAAPKTQDDAEPGPLNLQSPEPFAAKERLETDSIEKGRPPCNAPEPAVPGSHLPASSEGDLFFEALGLENVPQDPEERKRILLAAAALLKASVEGMIQSLQNRAAGKNELRLPVTTIELSGNNPFKFCAGSAMALNQIFTKNHDGMLEPHTAMYAGFNDLHGHNLGIMAGTRAAISAALDRLSPAGIEERLDGAGQVKIRRAVKLWQTFIKLHSELTMHDGLADFFLRDFARAYEMQIRTLKPVVVDKNKGELS